MTSEDVKNVLFIYQKYKKLILRAKSYFGAKVVKGQQEEEYKSIRIISDLHSSILTHGKQNQSF